MKLIVGLGNPTEKYRNTYHNLGFMTVDALAKQFKVDFKKEECKSKTASFMLGGEEIVLAKPQTYMNLSGEAVNGLVHHYGVDLSDLMVVYDDADIPVGKIRVRQNGSSGTHNGMRNIVKELFSENFNRCRIGIKDKSLEERSVNIIDKVLSPIAFSDREKINGAIDKAASGLRKWIEGKVTFEALMQELNK